jgi:hypothetical protein
MLEIGIALATASKAVAIIQKGFKLRKDASELTVYFSQFFDAKDEIAKARAQVDNSTLGSKVFAKQSVEAYALEVALAEHKTKELEKLRELFVYSGQAEVYTRMMRIRQDERTRRRINQRRVAEQKKFLADAALLCSMFVFTIGSLALLIYMII